MNNDDLFAWEADPEKTFGQTDDSSYTLSQADLERWKRDHAVVVPLEIEPKALYADCAHCPLVAMPCVPSYNPPVVPPSLILVGEAPGAQEVQKGQPFVGPSGQLLDAVLEHIGIAPSQCYKTNAVLCRPPNNDLSGQYASAVVACQERLRHELTAILTSDVVALGATAVAALSAFSGQVDKRGILARHGQRYALENDKTFLAAYHPAFVLRSAGYMAQFMQDLRSLTLDRSKDWLALEYQLVPQYLSTWVSWLADRIEDGVPIAIDVETANLATDSKLLAIGMTTSDLGAWIIPGDQITDTIRELLNRAGDRAHWVAHNGKFDQRVLLNNGIHITLAGDTMLQHYALDEIKGTHGLKNLAASFLGVPDYEAQLVDTHFKADKRESRDYSKIPTADLYKYLTIDCCATLQLYYLFNTMIDLDDVQQAYQILIDGSNALLQVETNGIKIDRAYLETVNKKLEDAILVAETTVKREAQPHVAEYLETHQPLGFFDRKPPTWIKTIDQYRAVLYKCLDINLNSWQQLQVLLYDVLQLKHVKKLGFKTDPRSTNAEALDALEDHPFVSLLKEYRRLTKIRSTYVVKLLELADQNDRVHINFNIHGTETGRLSANDGLHGIPRPSDQWGRAIRGSFIADQGKKLILADYAQAELRVFAAESGEPFLLDIFNNDRDPHGEACKLLFEQDAIVASAYYDPSDQDWHWHDEDLAWLYNQVSTANFQQYAKDYWKERRTTAKNVVFGGLVYLGGANGIAAMLGGKATAQQIQPVLVRLLAQMPTARKWQLEQFRKARKDGFVQSRFGNKRRFLLITDDNLDEIKKASVNAPIQNSASQLTLLSAIELHRKGIKVLHLNHDQLICEASDDLADRTAQLVAQTMVGMGNKWFPEVKWAVDVEVATSWYPKRPNFD